jgi:sn-glycerol 3-phosphate transport system substrate-binding protein
MLKKLLSNLIVVLVVLSLVPIFAIDAQDNAIELTLIHIFDDDLRPQVIQEIIDAYVEEYPNVVINSQSPSDDYVEVFNNALLAAGQGNAPNIVQIEEGLTQAAIDSGYFIPISEVASEEQLATLDDVLPSIRNYFRLGDTTWSVPWNVSNPVLYYNRGMFEAAGLDPDAPPRTFADVLDACDALMNSDLELSACINWPMVAWFPEQWIAMQNALIFNNDNGRSARATEAYYDSPEMLTIMTWWKELVDRGYFRYTGSPGDYTGEGITFLSRQTAMTINSTAGLTLFMNFSRLQGIELGVSRLLIPDEDATNGVTVGGGSLWLMADQSPEELQAAVDFIFYLTNAANDAFWHQGSGYTPTRFSSIDLLTEQGWFDENPFFRVAVDQLAETQDNIAAAGGVVGPSAEVRSYLVQAFQSVVDAGADPLEALQAAKARADAELAEYNLFFE